MQIKQSANQSNLHSLSFLPTQTSHFLFSLSLSLHLHNDSSRRLRTSSWLQQDFTTSLIPSRRLRTSSWLHQDFTTRVPSLHKNASDPSRLHGEPSSQLSSTLSQTINTSINMLRKGKSPPNHQNIHIYNKHTSYPSAATTTAPKIKPIIPQLSLISPIFLLLI